jgi:hypothetical protein
MRLIFATLALVLALDASADQTFTHNDGTKTRIYAATTDLTAVAYGYQGSDFRAFHVRDCALGRGTVEVYEPIKTGNDYSHRYIGRLDWYTVDTIVISKIAVYACATALAKAGLLK